ncbi:MAG: TonB-dependent receptor [Elusimicrobia bacterium]|nr:TonB-dependent receptor [Elusimicrobiota bacterium]
MKSVGWMLASVIVFLCCVSASAVEISTSAYIGNLNEIVVTAVRRAIPLKDAPANVTVIDKEAIHDSPSRTADDLLRTASGIDTLESDLTEKTKRSVRLRGVPNQGKTLVLLDGMPLNWPIHGDVEWNEVPLGNIERIEIVRGPFSCLYGSNAMGGVISILTRAPRKRFECRIKPSYGTNNTFGTTLNLGGKNSRFGYYFYGRHINTDGYYSALEPLPPHSTKNARRFDNLSGRLYYFPDNKTFLTLGSFYSNSDRNRGREFDNSHRQTGGSYLNYRHHTANGINWSSTVYWHRTNYQTEFDKRPTYDYVEHIETKYSTHWGAVTQASFSLRNWNILTAGVEHKHNGFNQDDKYLLGTRYAESKGEQQYWSIYGQDEMDFIDCKLILILGLRCDWWRSYDGACKDTNPSGSISPYDDNYSSKSYGSVNPKISMVYHITDRTTIRSSMGKGFQAPNVFEMYRSFQRGNKFYLSNPDLKPETLISYEFGVDRSFGNDGLTKITVYDSYGNDFIGNRQIAGTTYQVDNFTKVRIRGIEAEMNYRLARHCSFFSNYTYNKATVEKNDPDPTIEGNYLENSPLNKFNVGFAYDIPAFFKLNVNWRFVDVMYNDAENEEDLDAYSTYNISIERKVGKYLDLLLKCENIFDREYEIPDHTIQKAPGRFWTFSCAYEF